MAIQPNEGPIPSRDDLDQSEVISNVRSRASASRRAYNITLAVMLAIAMLLVTLFLYSGVLTPRRDTNGYGSSLAETVTLVATTLITRLGSVVAGIFVIQMLFSFARYHARLAQHLESVADVLQWSRRDGNNIPMLMTALAPQNVDFGKPPKSPIEHAASVATEVAKALAAKKVI